MKGTFRHLRAFVWKEVLTNLVNLRLPLALVLLPSLAVLGSVVSSIEYRRKVAAATSGLQEQEALLERIRAEEEPADRAYELLWSGIHSYRLPQPMSVLVRGLEGRLPVGFHAVSSGSRSGLRLETVKPDDRLYVNPLPERFQRPDLVQIIALVGSLLALWFGADSLTREREMQTLPVALANPVSRFAALSGKFLGALVSIVLPFLLALAAAVAVSIYVGGMPLSGDVVTRILLLAICGMVYLAVWISVGLLLSAICRLSSTALVTGLFVWLVLTMLVPAIAPLLARVVQPVAAQPKIQLWAKDRSEHAVMARDLRQGVLDPEEFFTSRQKTAQDRAMMQSLSVYEQSAKRQGRVSELVARFSPMATFALAAAEIAGVGPSYYAQVTERDRDFGRAHYEWALKLRLKLEAQLPNVESDVARGAIPSCSFPAPTVTESVARSLFDLLLLGSWVIVALLASYAVLVRQDLMR